MLTSLRSWVPVDEIQEGGVSVGLAADLRHLSHPLAETLDRSGGDVLMILRPKSEARFLAESRVVVDIDIHPAIVFAEDGALEALQSVLAGVDVKRT
jgi:hypothetical protein